jgi:hypothetical protein
LNEGDKSLAQFVMAQPMSIAANYDVCGERIPGGAMVAQIPAAETPAGAPAIPPQAAIPLAAAPIGESILPTAPDRSAARAGTAAIDQSGTVYSARNGVRSAPPPPKARTYQTRDRYARDPYNRSGDSYGYSNRYGERDPYYRNPYNRYWHGAEPQYYYLRRR